MVNFEDDRHKNNVYKWCFIVFIFTISMLAAMAPLKIESCRGNARYLGIANTFSGGVFMAIAFVHILPETAEMYYSIKL